MEERGNQASSDEITRIYLDRLEGIALLAKLFSITADSDDAIDYMLDSEQATNRVVDLTGENPTLLTTEDELWINERLTFYHQLKKISAAQEASTSA